jgi:hypothetical protein
MATQTNYQFTWGNSVDGFLHTFLAEGAITEGQLLELGTAGRQVKTHTTTQTTPVIGIAHESAADGAEVVVLCPGPIRKVLCAAAGITRGEMVIPDGTTAGSCTSQAYADGTTLHGSVGIALETGDALGERVPVLCGWPGVVSNA